MPMRLFLALCCLIASTRAFATTYYLSQSGNDLNDGLTPATAWQTMVALNAVSLAAGDSVLFHSGDLFRGTWNVQATGSSGQPIYIGIYGGAAAAVINGSLPVTNWVNAGNGVFKAFFSTQPVALFVNGMRQTNARFPNTGWIRVDSSVSNTGLISDALTQPDGYWNGAFIRMRTTPSTFEFKQVQDYSNGEIAFASPTSTAIQKGNGFYFDGIAAAFDTIGEWVYDDALDTVGYRPPVGLNPATALVEAPVQNNGFRLNNASFVKIENLVFRLQREYGVLLSGNVSNVEITNCAFENCQLKGIESWGTATNINVHNNTVSDILGMGITFEQMTGCRVTNNVIRRIGLVDGYGIPWDQHGLAIGCPNVKQSYFAYNKIDTVAGMALRLIGDNDTVVRNRVNFALARLSGPLGAFFHYGNETNNVVFKENIILNIYGNCESCNDPASHVNGVQIVFGTHDLLFEGNTIANVSGDGIHLGNGAQNALLRSNLIYNAQFAQVQIQSNDLQPISTFNVRLLGNVLYALSPFQKCLRVSTNSDTIAMAQCDSNYYVNPYDYSTIEYLTTVSLFPAPHLFTLPEWQKALLEDDSSESTYITLPRYITTSVDGNELITNGHFTNNFNNWTVQPETFSELLLDSWNAMDGGNAKVVLHSTDSGYAQLTSSPFDLIHGQLYQLGFSLYSLRTSFVNPEVFEFTNGGYTPAGYKIWRRSFAQRRDFVDHFVANNATSNISLKIALSAFDSIYWIDNVSLLPVSGVKLDSTFYSRLIVNTSTNPVTYDFGDSTFFNLDSIAISDITLQPYQSAVVIYVDGIVTGVSHQAVLSNVKLWPNPSSDVIYVSMPCESGAAQFELYDVRGALVEKGSWRTCTNRLDVKRKSPGLYLLKVFQNGSLYTAKFVVSR